MTVRRGPAIVLSLGLSAAAFAMAPTAIANDGRPAKDGQVVSGTAVAEAKDTDPCSAASKTRLRVETNEDGVMVATGMVWSDDGNLWDWRFKHNDDLSARGEIRADEDRDRSFKVTRNMVNLIGPDYIVFRAQNEANDEVCRVDLYY